MHHHKKAEHHLKKAHEHHKEAAHHHKKAHEHMKHADMKEDKALIRKMVKKKDLK
jgi:hypothetical protein